MKKEFQHYLSLVKFSHTVFALPFALLGYVWGIAQPGSGFSAVTLALILVCMVTARNSAMAFNRLADWKIDQKNPRTASREIPAGKISRRNAGVFIIINMVLFVVAAGMINLLTLLLSPVALVVILGYSLTKRFSWICHYVLGLSLGIAPVAAFISVTGRIDLFSQLLCIIVICWTSGFDILYSLQDESFDASNRLHSIPVSLGRKKSLLLSALLHLITASLVVLLGIYYDLNFIYWIGAVTFIGILVREHLIVTVNDISRVNLAFATLNGAGSIIYCTFAIVSILWGLAH